MEQLRRISFSPVDYVIVPVQRSELPMRFLAISSTTAPSTSPMPVAEQVAIIYCGTHGLMHQVPVEQVRKCQDAFLDMLRSTHPEVLEELAKGKLDDSLTAVIEQVMADVAGQYKN